MSAHHSITTYPMNLNPDAKALYQFLKQAHPANVLMPCGADKNPLRKHAGGKWGWEQFEAFDFKDTTEMAILLKDLVVIDLDDHDLCQHVESLCPEMRTCPCVETRHGKHYYFKRTPRCDELGLYDKARIMGSAEDALPIDLKTVAATGTAGVIVVPPSCNKKWVRPLWSTPLLDVPEELASALYEMKGAAKANTEGGEPTSVAAMEELFGEDIMDKVDDLLTPYATGTRRIGERKAAHGFSLHYKTRGQRTCPNGHKHTKNCFFLNVNDDGTVWYRCLSSECKDKPCCFLGKWKSYDWLPEPEEAAPPAPRQFNIVEFAGMLQSDTKEGSQPPTDTTLAYFNRFFIRINGKKTEVLQVEYDEQGKVFDFVRRNVKETATQLMAAQYPLDRDGHTALKPYFDFWLRHLGARTVKRLVFDPQNKHNEAEEFNMFVGLRIERTFDLESITLDASKIDLVLNLLYEVFADGRKELYDYMLRWLRAVVIEKRKTGVAWVIYDSAQGVGKGCFVNEFLGRLLIGGDERGQRGVYSQISDIEKIVGKFNDLSVNRLLINADECSSFGGAYKQNNRLKNIITEPTRDWEQKGLDALVIDDYANFIFTTNTSDPVKVECGDRRFLVARPNDKYKGDTAFWDKVFAQVNDEGAAHFYKYLESLPPSGNLKAMPSTDERLDLMSNNIPVIALFLRHKVESGVIRDGYRRLAAEFYADYNEWKEAQGLNEEMSLIAFGKRMRKFGITIKGGGNANQYQFNRLDAIIAKMKADMLWIDA